MPTLFITGANRGLGLEFCKQYSTDGWRIYATCRNPDNAAVLQELAAASGGQISVHKLEVTDHAQIEALAQELDGVALDLLINNAGVIGERNHQTFQNMDYDNWRQTMETNVYAPLKIVEAFAANLARGQHKHVITISSLMASPETHAGDFSIYRCSKAAVNSIMKGVAVQLKDQGIRVNILHPGWVQTDMGGPSAAISPQESVTGMRTQIAGFSSDDTGIFVNYAGEPMAW